ncbi:hypothetical protein SAMN04488102_101195 [Alkalibacterium subtropicum]|uniref:Uncharacterized protein n=1 Tax=Alkalibacterium subtropicum TaxID=753702 RepID=A0A1I1EIT5_9LACT|nr:hypothetical protein [Alkalibacterium subtropicum]SFB87035.1 hypothetical protein SAMN04488102_101195 [Alkalibacterium subtropicum]
MSRIAENRHSIVHYLKKGYGSLFPSITNVHPQMPKEQIATFLKQAVKNRYPIVIQVNPTSQSDSISEFTGIAYLSPKSTQVIIKSDLQSITYLISARDIRYIRRLYKRK